ncbi:MAG: CmcI family methyltransferase [Candidatus Sulfotelmatobacter sp.]
MNGDADKQAGPRSSSTTFLRIVAILSLALASGEFLLASYYRRESERNVDQKFLQIYYNSLVWLKTRWLGVPSQQAPTDNWSMQEIIAEVRPDYVIETGTANGGTSLFYAVVLSFVNPEGKVITVDVEPHVEEASKLPIWKQRVEMILGSSVDPKVTDHIAQEVSGKKVLVTLDSLHTHDHVLREMEIYSKLVTPGSYLVVQDTNVNGHPVNPGWGPGPMEAVEDFLKTHDNFVVDRSREKFLLTFYPRGWLKRVK